MDSARLYILGVTAAVLSVGLVLVVRPLAFRLGVVDRGGGRRVNAEPVPRLGGVAIFGSVILVLGAAWFAGAPFHAVLFANPLGVLGFALGALLIFATGVVDDVWGLRPRTKLLLEMLAALLVVGVGGCRVEQVSFPGGPLVLGVWSVPVTFFWLVLVMNAINLVDGLDGLAAGISVLSLAAVGVIAGPAHASVSVFTTVLIGATVGFLLHNFYPASIFMGDSGSLFLGFSLGVLSIYANAKSAAGGITAAALLVLAFPLTDTIWAVGRRYIKGWIPTSMHSYVASAARVFVPDRHHLHHRLLDRGFGQREVIYVLYGVQAAACLIAVYLGLLWTSPRPVSASPPPAPAQAAAFQPPSAAVAATQRPRASRLPE